MESWRTKLALVGNVCYVFCRHILFHNYGNCFPRHWFDCLYAEYTSQRNTGEISTKLDKAAVFQNSSSSSVP